MRRFGLGDRWAFHGLHDDNRCFGMSAHAAAAACTATPCCLINLHGGTEPRPELYATDRLVYLETDPVQLQTELHDGRAGDRSTSSSRTARSSRYAENYGNPDCRLPVAGPLPVPPHPPAGDHGLLARARAARRAADDGRQLAPAVARRRPRRRALQLEQAPRVHEVHRPAAAAPPSRSSWRCRATSPADKEMLEGQGWQVRHALDFSTDPDAYRDYITDSRGEFTVAKDQNVRLRTGWFSDRSATYLAAGRPGDQPGHRLHATCSRRARGCSASPPMDEILAAVEAINSDYPRHTPRRRGDRARVLRARRRARPPARGRRRGPAAAGAGYPVTQPRHGPVPGRSRPARRCRAGPRGLRRRPRRTSPRAPVPSAHGAALARMPAGEHRHDRARQPALHADVPRERAGLHRVPGLRADRGRQRLRATARRSTCASWRQRNPHVRLVLNQRNAGFARACNQGLALARRRRARAAERRHARHRRDGCRA